MKEKVKGLIDEINGALNTGTPSSAEEWLRYIRDRLEKIIKTAEADTNEERQKDNEGFMECVTCAATPGMPELCLSCLNNRDVIHRLVLTLDTEP